ncbi:MAG: hypothetical protein RLW62_02900, partial [Gammaproteobacteria bacterium]
MPRALPATSALAHASTPERERYDQGDIDHMNTWISRRGAAIATLAASLLGSTQAFAAGAVTIQDFDGGPGAHHLAAGDTLTRSGATGNPAAFSTNPALDGSAWAHTGRWWTFHLMSDATTTVTVTADDASVFTPALTIWASGDTAFDGGTTGFLGEVSTAGFGTPHSFNATGVLGNSGTLWMASGFGGNMLETLAYASAGADVASGGWGESLLNGVHDVSLTNAFESGISGTIGAGEAEIVLADLVAGYYTVFVGGADINQAGGSYTLSVSAVPLPAAMWLRSE